MKKRLIATDFDGTLYRGGCILKYDRKMIEKWQAAGNYFGVVTGRGQDFVEKAKAFGLDPDYLIVYNGSLILDRNGKTVYENLIPRDTFKAIEDFFGQFDDALFVDKADDNEFYYQHYSTFDNAERALEIAEQINKTFGDRITAFVNGPHINIAQKGASKSNGVSTILAHYGLTEDEGAVVGDDYNDIEMIKEHKGWAVITARPAVKEAASHICLSVGTLATQLMK